MTNEESTSKPIPRERVTSYRPILLLFSSLLIGAVLLAGHLFTREWTLVHDELFHHQQMIRFFEGDFTILENLTTIPGYNALLAFLNHGVPNPSRITSRMFNVIFSAALMAVVWMVARRLTPGCAEARTLQVLFLPLLFPYFFLIYTDVLSLLLFLAAFLMLLHNRPSSSGLIIIISLLVRQNNIVWLGFLFCYGYVLSNGWSVQISLILSYLRSAWVYLLGVLLFGIFVVINGGVAIGDKSAHPPLTFSAGNVYYFTFIMFFLVPLIDGKAVDRAYRMLISKSWLAVPLVGLVTAIVYATFSPSHAYNFIPYFVRNDLFDMIRSDTSWAIGFAALSAIGFLLWLSSRPVCPTAWLIPIFTILALIPSWLIEPRYGIIPWVLWMLHREEDDTAAEWSIVPILAVLSAATLLLVSTRIWFL